MEINIKEGLSKTEVFRRVQDYLQAKKFNITQQDDQRPWGGFFVIEESQAEQFIQTYFPGYATKDLLIGNKLSPKILLIEPGKRLSWQYHRRRAEIWRVLQGDVEITVSDTGRDLHCRLYRPGEIITLRQGQRHRLKGLDTWGIVAEIWQHTDINHPSDEEDIVRLEDDFGRG